MICAAIGIGSNLGDAHANVHDAFAALRELGRVARRSRCYQTRPWGLRDQPDFVNAAALLETDLSPLALLDALAKIEKAAGRVRAQQWGPRTLDLDILTYGDATIDDDRLRVPHPLLFERAFALVPLADIDSRYREMAAEVVEAEGGETVALMPEPMADRVRLLAQAFVQTDLVRLRIEDANADAIELRRKASNTVAPAEASAALDALAAEVRRPDAIKADLVGIVRFARPVFGVGDVLETDRELAYVEALGIRTSVRSKGAGRIAAINVDDGDPVEYAEVLFEIDRADG